MKIKQEGKWGRRLKQCDSFVIKLHNIVIVIAV